MVTFHMHDCVVANSHPGEAASVRFPARHRWQRISPLLDDLLDLDTAGRELRLDELRRHDARLALELRSLLQASKQIQATGFLNGEAQHEGASPSLVGRKIGAYVIEAALGQGGTGSVWRARRAGGRIDDIVAIKLLHLSLVGRSGAWRFEREAAILARLAHPNISRLIDTGVTADGQPYLVLEFVDGVPIDRHCDESHLTIEQRLALLDDVMSGVTHAHKHMVIHRDIKPNNILVTPDGTVKLLDFGIAKVLRDGAESTSVTAEGQRAMTPRYAAPEQLQGTTVTTATDVYALGVLMYHLLAGRHPTVADTAGMAEVMRATLHADASRLSRALDGPGGDGAFDIGQVASNRGTSLHRLREQLRGDLENIVAVALRKDPAQRYQTVSTFAGDLRRYLAHQPVSARPDSLACRWARFARRNRSAMMSASLAAFWLTAGLAAGLYAVRLI